MAVEIAVAYVSVVPSFRGVRAAADRQLGDPLNQAADAAGRNSSRSFVSRFTSGLDRAGGRVARAGDRMTLGITAPLAFAALKVTGFASDLNESVNATNVVFGRASGIITDFARTSAESVGLSERAFRQAVTPMGAMLQNLGLNQQQAAEWAVRLTQRSSDMASVFNTDVSEALDAINAGLRGESDPLERFGVGLNEAAVQAEAVRLGLASQGDELTANQKAQARLSLIMGQTNRIAGDFANTSNEVANAERIEAARAEDAAAAFGQRLLPAKRRLIQVAGDLLNWFNGLSRSQQDMAIKAGLVVAAFGPVMSIMGRLARGISGTVRGIALFGRGTATVARGSVSAAQGLGRLVGGFRDARVAESAFSGRLGTLGGRLRTVANGVANIATAVARTAVHMSVSFARMAAQAAVATARVAAQIAIQVARWVFLGVQSLLAAAKVALAWLIALGPIGIVIAAVAGAAVLIIRYWDEISGFVIRAARAVVDFLARNWPLILAILTGPFGLAVLFVVRNWDTIRETFMGAVRAVIDFLRRNGPTILAVITGPVGLAVLFITRNWGTIRETFNRGVAFVKSVVQAGMNLARDYIINPIRTARDTVSQIWERIKTTANNAAAWVRDQVKAKFTAVKDGILSALRGARDAMGAIWETIKSKVRSPVNAIIGFINRLLGGLDRVLELLPGNLNLNYRIPRLAIGGVVGGGGGGLRFAAGGVPPFKTDGIRAIVGEGKPGYPEYVIPTDPAYRNRAIRLHADAARRLGVPGFQFGGLIGDIAGAVRDAVGGAAGFFRRGAAEAIFRPIKAVFNEALRTLPWGFLRQIGRAFIGWISDFVSGVDREGSAIPDTPGPGGGVERWRNVALAALRYTGQSVSWIGDLLTQMAHESGGNPRAINLSDINALRGDPSRGLMQTIMATFLRYARELAGRGIYDPFANIVAAIRYTVARYGSLGVWRRRGFKGYAHGGVADEDGLGFLHRGEAVFNPAQLRVLSSAIAAPRAPGAVVVIDAAGADRHFVTFLRHIVRTRGGDVQAALGP